MQHLQDHDVQSNNRVCIADTELCQGFRLWNEISTTRFRGTNSTNSHVADTRFANRYVAKPGIQNFEPFSIALD